MLLNPTTPPASPAPSDRRPIAVRRFAIFQNAAAALARAGISPNSISLFGMACGIGAGAALWATGRAGDSPISTNQRILFLAAAALIQTRLLCNMLDGMVAVEGNRRSPEGELYNEIPDRISDSFTIIGAGYALSGWPLMGFIAALLAVMTAYIRAVGKGTGLPSDFGGPMAKQQRMALITIVSLFFALAPDRWQPRMWHPSEANLGWIPDRGVGLMGGLLVIIALGAALTCALRIRRINVALRTRAAAGGTP
jgi:phosphatidylglycerophosphate synthase